MKNDFSMTLLLSSSHPISPYENITVAMPKWIRKTPVKDRMTYAMTSGRKMINVPSDKLPPKVLDWTFMTFRLIMVA